MCLTICDLVFSLQTGSFIVVLARFIVGLYNFTYARADLLFFFFFYPEIFKSKKCQNLFSTTLYFCTSDICDKGYLTVQLYQIFVSLV